MHELPSVYAGDDDGALYQVAFQGHLSSRLLECLSANPALSTDHDAAYLTCYTFFSLQTRECCGRAVYKADVMNGREATVDECCVLFCFHQTLHSAGAMRLIALCQCDETNNNSNNKKT